MVFSKACDGCGGSGRIGQTSCMACGGAGQEVRTETVTVRVPPGVADGSRIRVPEKGHAGAPGGRTGDLYIAVQVERHELFQRDGDDFHVVVPVAVHEAALGARIEVPAPDGHARLRVPPGTQSGQRFRVRGRGAPSPRTGERGDLVVEVKLMLPRVLDERSKSSCASSAESTATTYENEEDRQGLFHDQRGGAEIPDPPADVASLRA
jgi:molecular chaperone DnaJ